MISLKIILGSTRPQRFSEKLVPWLKDQLAQKNEFEAEFLDLRDWHLPFLDQAVSPKYVKGGDYPNEKVRAWGEKIKQADAFLVIAPEYNRGAPGVLKNAFDSIFWEWSKKPVAFVGYGEAGAAFSIAGLRLTAIEMGMVPTQKAVHLPGPWVLPDETEPLKQELEKHNKELQTMLDQLLWLSQTLKTAREK